MRIFGVILAGGGGLRMGGADKALLRLAGQSLIAHAVARLQPQVERLAISANGDAARFAGLGLPVLRDAVPMGPLSGVLSALHWAAYHGGDAVVSVAVDTPFFPHDLVARLGLAAATSAEGVALAQSDNLHPTFGLWPVSLAASLRAFLASGAKARIRQFALDHGAAIAAFPPDGAFCNLNTPQDLAAANALAAP